MIIAPWPEYEAAKKGQADAARPEASAWVEANAGSGKTKVLIDRVARLLLRRVDPDSILCVTYTKAAASEMQSRLFARLGGWCVMPEAELRGRLADLEQRPPDAYTPEDIGRARELFARALETPGGLRIETIHAFCSRVLRRFPIEAGVAPGFRELDDDDAADLWDAAFRLMARRVVRGDAALMEAARIVAEAAGGRGFDIVRTLLPMQREIERYVEESGGMDPAMHRLRLDIGAGDLDADAIIGRAMGEELPREVLKQLIAAMPAAKPTDEKLAQTLAFALSDAPAADRFDAYLSIPFTNDGEPRKTNPYTADALRAAPGVALLFQTRDVPQGSEIQRILAATQALKARRLYDRSGALLRLARLMFDDFAVRKRARAGLDFDDLVETTGRLLTRRHAAEWVLWKLDGGISHVLLDEAQDTSPSQWTILRALTDDIFAGSGAARPAQRTLFVVGDQKQSIYSFQGADPEKFREQKQRFVAAASTAKVAHETPELAMSFRSTRQVLDFVDAAFDLGVFPDRAPFTLSPPDDADIMRHTPYRRDAAGSVDLWPLEPRPETTPAEPWTAPRGQESADSPKARLARRIAQFIRREIDQGGAIWDGGHQRPARPGDFLILVRGRTGGLFDGILQELKRAKIPVAGADRIRLLDSLPVQDLLNLVRFALCPEDDLVLAEILRGPFGAYGPAEAPQWIDEEMLFALAHLRPRRLWPALLDAADERLAPVRAFLVDAIARRDAPPFEFLSHALERGFGLPRPGWELVLARFGDPAREPVTALVDRAAGFDADRPPSLQVFLDAVERQGGELKRELSGPQDEVRVMTVHGAKGLEAPVVILPDTASGHREDRDGLFVTEDGAPVWAGARAADTPLSERLREEANARSLREHRRLLYVALTRAQDRLVVCGAAKGNAKDGHDKTSWYRLCEAAMSSLVSSGRAGAADDNGYSILRFGEAAPRLASGQAGLAPANAIPAWLFRPAPSERRARMLSPSRLTAAQEPPAISPFGSGRAERLRRGALIHLLFETLPHMPAGERRAAAQGFLARQADLQPAQRAEMLAAVFGVLDDPRFAGVFGPGGRPEAPVIGRIGQNRISGRVDRLVITPTEILVVDYKTDRPAPASVADVGEAYIAQMAAYREVLSQRWPDRAVRCLLVWTDGPKLMEIPVGELDLAISRLR